jgi:hypothetical protein
MAAIMETTARGIRRMLAVLRLKNREGKVISVCAEISLTVVVPVTPEKQNRMRNRTPSSAEILERTMRIPLFIINT